MSAAANGCSVLGSIDLAFGNVLNGQYTTREDMSDITGIRTTTIQLEILCDVIPNIDLMMTWVDSDGLVRSQAAVPVDIGGEVIRVHAHRPTEPAGGELVLVDQTPDSLG
jgi:hypothetical protein